LIIQDEDAAIAEWVGRRLGETDFGLYRAIGIARRGKLVAGIVYNHFNGTSIDMTIASDSPRWASRQVLWRLFHYPFNELKCRRVTATTGITNQPARAFLCRLGFSHEGTHPEGKPDGESVVSYGMTRSACRWLGERHE
jgi:RimJ/RimL family protein N-acetyltransferase